MSDRLLSPIQRHTRCIAAMVAALLCSLVAPGMAWAQDAAANPQQPPAVPLRTRGVLIVRVRSAEDGLPISLIAVRTDSETERPSFRLTGSDGDGVARLVLNPGTYRIILNGAVAGFETREGINPATKQPYALPGHEGFRDNVVVTAGQATTIDFVLDHRVDIENISRRIELIDRNETGDVTIRDRQFFDLYPFGAGDRQSLPLLLRSVPGFVQDAINQTHPRGENSVTTATYLNGFLIPPIPAETAAHFIAPDALSSFKARVGGFSPEYGGGSGAIIELQTHDVQPQHQFLDLTYRNGDYGTNEIYLNFGNTIPFHQNDVKKGRIQRMRYVFSLSQRYTDEALEAPQDGYPNSANYGASEIFFAKVDFDLANHNTVTALANFSSGRTGIANRSGLNDSFTHVGAGFGFGGESNGNAGLESQDQLGQNFRQKDNNSLVMLQFAKKEFNASTRRDENRMVVSLGVTSNTQVQLDQGGTPTVGYPKMPLNSSIEYLPTVLNDYEQIAAQIDFTPRVSGRHQWKYGALYQDISALDSFQLIPQSQDAINELFQLDPQLVPPGALVPGAVDDRGNPVYKVNTSSNPNPSSPVLYADKDGYYAAAYIQDTFKIRPSFRVNYGLRLDSYQQNIQTKVQTPVTGGPNDGKAVDLPGINTTTVSPRINMALMLPEKTFKSPTIVRASYNRVVTPPGMNQGVFLRYQPHTDQKTFADIAIPQTSDNFDLGIEMQIGRTGIARLSGYTKNINNMLTTQEIIPRLQSDLLSVYNMGHGTVDGAEISYEYLPPPDGIGLSGFVSYANSASGPNDNSQFNNLNQVISNGFYDHDQTNTLSAGLAYGFHGGASIGASAYYGSGLFSSSTYLLGTQTRQGEQQTVSQVNLRLSTGPRWLSKRFGVDFLVENLFNTQGRYEFGGPLGVRYEQGRRVFIALSGRL